MMIRGRLAVFLLAFCLLLPWPPTLTAAEERPLVFAALPTETPEIVLKEIRPLLDWLEKKLTVKFRVEYSATHEEVLEKFRQGKVDLAYLGPLPYVELKERHPAAEPLVIFREADGEASYTCSLIAALDGVAGPAELAGKPVALIHPLSTCGYLGMENILRRHGLTLAQTGHQYLMRHDRVALAVARGEFAAGGVKSDIGRKYFHLGLTAIAESEPVPGRPLVANGATLSAETRRKIAAALTAPDPRHSETDAAIARGWGKHFQYGAVAAADADFDILRAMRRGVRIPTLDLAP